MFFVFYLAIDFISYFCNSVNELFNMKNSSPLFYNSLIAGLITSAILVLYSSLLYIFKVDSFNLFVMMMTFVFQLTVLILGMVFGVLHYRNKYCGGFIDYKNAFISCLLIGINAAIVVSLFTFVLYKFIAPELLQDYIDHTIEMLQKYPTIPEDKLTQIYNEVSKQTPESILMGSVVQLSIGSGILSLIIAAFAKKEKGVFDDEDTNNII